MCFISLEVFKVYFFKWTAAEKGRGDRFIGFTVHGLILNYKNIYIKTAKFRKFFAWLVPIFLFLILSVLIRFGSRLIFIFGFLVRLCLLVRVVFYLNLLYSLIFFWSGLRIVIFGIENDFLWQEDLYVIKFSCLCLLWVMLVFFGWKRYRSQNSRFSTS